MNSVRTLLVSMVALAALSFSSPSLAQEREDGKYVLGQVGQVLEYLRSKSSGMRFFYVRGEQVMSADMWGTP